eukprot:2245375-Lingulodinium_polyedra.AAC.1
MGKVFEVLRARVGAWRVEDLHSKHWRGNPDLCASGLGGAPGVAGGGHYAVRKAWRIVEVERLRPTNRD